MPSTPAPLKSSFEPFADPATRVLILGSLPGDVSLARGQYYGNPRNQFWRLLESAAQVSLPEDYEARLAALQAVGVGLWDVVHSAQRVGSLDGAIRAHQPNALAEFAATLPRLRAIAFNGGKAAAIGAPQLAGRTAAILIPLPSSSPANTTPFEVKRAAWRALGRFLVSAPGAS
jgi:hypoxanthine-DNA glycosylase